MSCTQVIVVVIMIAITVSQIYILMKISEYKKILESKNIKLVQFYLDMKFLGRAILENLNLSDSNLFCRKLISEIKEYYNLEDVIIIDSIAMATGEKSTPVRSLVVEKIGLEFKRIKKEISHNQLYSEEISINDKTYIFYTSSITPDVTNDGIIVCIERGPSLLTEQELVSLENSINILKTRLIYA